VRFAARVPGLASGLALAVRPAGSAEAPGSMARRRRVARSAMRSTVDAGGADPDNARRSDPVAVTFRTAIGALGASVTAWSCSCGAASGPWRRGPAAAGAGAAVRGSSSRRRASARRARRKLPPRNGETPATLAAYHRSPGRPTLPRLLAPARVAGSGRRRGAPKVRP
jgi:hypothetical protein